MRILNQTGYPAEFTMGMDKADCEYVILVFKKTKFGGRTITV